MAIPLRYVSNIKPHKDIDVIPYFDVNVTHTPFTVKSLGMGIFRYKLNNNQNPNFLSLNNLTLLDSGITHLCGFYSGSGSPVGLTVLDDFAIRYQGYFYTKISGQTSNITFKVIGYGNCRLNFNNSYIFGGSNSFISLNPYTYTESSEIDVSLSEWVLFNFDYYIRSGESGFVLLWKDNINNTYLPVSAGIVNIEPTYLSSSTISDISSIDTIVSNREIPTYKFKVPLVTDTNIDGYRYNKDRDTLISNSNYPNFIKKHDLIKINSGYTEKNGVLFLNGVGDYLSISHSDQTGLSFDSDDFFIECLVKHNSALGQDRTICRKYNGSSDGGYKFVIKSNGTLEFICYEKGSSDSVTAISNETVDDNEWHYIAVSGDRSESDGLKLYIDGAEVTYSTQEDLSSLSSIGNDTHNFIVGSNYGQSESFSGYMDELRIWNFSGNSIPTNILNIVQEHNDNKQLLSGSISHDYLKARWRFNG